MSVNHFSVDVNGTKYKVWYITHGNPDRFSETSYTFQAEIDGVLVPLKCQFDNEFVGDLCCVMGLNPVMELANIAMVEIKKELSGMLISNLDKEPI